MNRLLTIIARIFGGLFYPLWIPTYGMLFYCLTFSTRICQLSPLTSAHHLSTPLLSYSLIAIIGTFFFTGLVPLIAILVMIRRGQVTDLYITRPQERTMPYLYTLCGYGFWCYFLYGVLHVPTFFFVSAIGATLALATVMFINKYWKISAHLTGLGGLIGGILSWFLFYHIMPSIGFIAILLGVALLLMYSRIYVNAHTPLQVVCGFLLGIIFTFVPNIILAYAK